MLDSLLNRLLAGVEYALWPDAQCLRWSGALEAPTPPYPPAERAPDFEAAELDFGGKSDYHAFRSAIKASPGRVVLVAFDLLHVDGQDLRGETTFKRRAALRRLLADAPAAIN